MKVIISTEIPDNFTNFVVVDSFKRVQELSGVTTLVIHKYIESDFDAGVFISSFHKSGINQFVLLNENPSSTIRMVLKGVNGSYFEDEFYLEDEEELLSLLDDLGMNDTVSTELAAPALDVVSDFIQSFARGEERIKAPLYLERVTQAVNELSEITHQQELQISTMGASAIEVFERASSIIKNMDTQRKLIEKQLQELEENQVTTTTTKASFGNNIMFFAPYKYIGNAKVLLIREYAPSRYLTSFCLGYAHYLHYQMNKRVKLIFVHQKGAGVSAKYNDFPMITQESMSIGSLYDAEIVATNNPKKEVMKELLSKQNDIYIVVDRLYGSQDIVSGRIARVNVASSRSDVQRYKLKPEETIFSVTAQPKQLFCLQTIKQFPNEADARYAAYSMMMENNYKLLNGKLGI